MKDIIQKYSKLLKKKFPRVEELNSQSFYAIQEGSYPLQIAVLWQAYNDRNFIVLFPTNQEAESFYQEMLSFVSKESLYYLPGRENIPYEYTQIPPDIKRDRILALCQISLEKPSLFISSVAGFLQTIPDVRNLITESLFLEKGKHFNLTKLIQKFINIGYERQEVCENYGTFTVKGSIIDIFPSNHREPIRLDFFDEELEEIRFFDPNTQRSGEKLSNVKILPSSEYILTPEDKENYWKILKNTNLNKPEEDFLIIEELLPLIQPHYGFLNFFKTLPIIIAPNLDLIKEKALQIHREWKISYERKKDTHLIANPEDLYSTGEEFQIIVDKNIPIQFTSLPKPPGKENLTIIETKDRQEFKGKIREAREHLELLLQDLKNKVLITSSFYQQTKRLQHLFSSHGIQLLNPENEEVTLIPPLLNEKNNFFIVLSELKKGFEIPSENLFIFTENDIFGREYKRKTRYKKTSSRAIESFLDLKEGDYVVHINHGIGRFKSIERIKADGKIRDFLKLEYANESILYVPLDQISLVQRYVGGLEHPKLDDLGKLNWKRTKERVRQSIEKLAEDLVKMYANRMKLKGYSYPPDTIWQEEFEAEFEYEETPDQLAAIDAVKKDLESDKPMDRLICGDVGYGKTEVAIRAAFKVIMAGRQVLFMCPTTILTLQHFNTFSERFKNYPIRLDYVSRFKTPTQNKKTLEDFQKGQIDMLIGTHAVLNQKLAPKNLGLLIIDEEQKFGVEHKEAIKKIKQLVDVLTLTATPIPRTLHMALTGIRDLSIIATPPKNRHSVETYVMEENDEIMEQAIRKEIERGGQVFYLHNRVETIENEARKLYQMMPDIAIGVLHGQMDEEEVEFVLMDFYSRKYDVLVTTSIIESGIDMPNVNTLIIQRADTFGLSQLYQLRGRVGRSDKKAYAYLFYPKGRLITEQAEKRLNTIFEYQELGSGFKVAMRDLEIRGAGNLLGKEQSGDIMEIGFDLYVKMLEEAISRIKGDELEIEIRTQIQLSTNFYIPDDYIPDTRQKIEFYKKFEACQSLEELEDVIQELKDRFGEPNPVVNEFIYLEKIRTIASQLGFESIQETEDEIKIRAGENFKGDPSSVVRLLSIYPYLKIHPSDPKTIRMKVKGKNQDEKIQDLLNILQQIQPKKISRHPEK